MFQIKKISKDILNTIRRFPMPLLSGFLAFVFFIIEIHFLPHDSVYTKNYTFIKLALECVSAISYFIAIDIFSESKKIEFSKRLGLYILGFCILGLHFFSITPGMFDSESVFVSRYLIFLACFHLLVSFSAFHQKNEIRSFWQYNYFLFVRIIISIAYSATLYIGLAGALLAIDKLFEVALDYKLYAHLLLFIVLIVNTLLFLYQLPASFDYFKPKQEFNRSIRIFVQYILLPIVLIYLFIMYVYLFNIILTKNLPPGWVCIPILIFSIVGILAYLLIYPVRLNTENKLIFIFSKYFFYILLPLLSLYFVGIIKRILPYGITEDRYLLVMLGVWLLVISIYIIISRKDNIIIIPVSLFVLLFVSAIGPWGMFQLSVQNQVRRLESLLKKNHLLVNNKLITPPEDFKISEQNANSIRSILNYLNKRGQINQIHKWLDENDQKVLSEAIARNELNAVNAIFTNIHIKPEPRSTYISFVPNHLFMKEIPLNAGQYKNILEFVKNDNTQLSQMATAVITDSMLYIFHHRDTLIRENISEFKNRLLQFSKMSDSVENARSVLNSKVQIVANDVNKSYTLPSDSLIIRNEKYKIYINKIEWQTQNAMMSLRTIEGILLY